MKKVFLLVVSLIAAGLLAVDDLSLLQRRVEALSLGETTLAYRLISLTASLSIAAATDNDALVGLLENVDSTLANGKVFLSAQDKNGPFSKDIVSLIDDTIRCSAKVKAYTLNKSYDNLQSIRGCMDALDGRIVELTERFNKAAPTNTTTNPSVKGQ